MNKIAGEFNGIKIYLFGSALTKTSPRDIDLLFVYSDERYDFDRILKVRRCFKAIFCSALKKEVDIILLSDKETLNNSFIEDEGAVLIYG